MPLTPFEKSRRNCDSLILGMMEAISVSHMCKAADGYEHELSKGKGAPPMDMIVDVSLMWGQVSEFARPEVH